MEWIETGFARLGEAVGGMIPAGPESILYSLIVDGIIGGVGGVLVFLPNIVLLFLAISLLEDSGYMARAAFVMDRVMKTVGLHGKSFIPMLLGFGCSIPAIMATRTIESRRARMTTMLIIPLMSCSARLPIYALVIPAFFVAQMRASVLWIIYLIGVALAMCCAWLLRKTLFAGEGLPFLMELPPYRLPTIRSITRHVAERSWLYVRKAGTIILGISIIMWALATFPRLDPETAAAQRGVAVEELDDRELASARLDHSFVGRVGHAIEPIVAPMGFDWKIGTALVGAFAAKEVFVAQLGIVYSVESPDETGAAHLRERLRADYSPLVGFCVMLFALIATPCMATVAVIRRESGSWGWAAFQFIGLTVLAWIVTVIVYQTATVAGLGVS
jgi:ferrous iron transport protein B